MNREEEIDLLLDLIIKHSANATDIRSKQIKAEDIVRKMPYTSAMDLIDDIIKHEQDTLKEFVEWLKQRYKGQGLVMTLDDISHLLDSELEDFIKEREK